MSGVVLKGKETPKKLNQLAREQMKLKLLADINTDIIISKTEGRDYIEYLNELKSLIDDLIPKK